MKSNQTSLDSYDHVNHQNVELKNYAHLTFVRFKLDEGAPFRLINFRDRTKQVIKTLKFREVQLSSTNDYYYLSQTDRMFLPLLVNFLQIYATAIIIYYTIAVSPPAHTSQRFKMFMSTCIFPIVAITLTANIYGDLSPALRVILGIQRKELTHDEIHTWDYLFTSIEILIIFLICIATIFVLNTQTDVLGVLFNFAGMLVILNFDNIIVQASGKRFLLRPCTETDGTEAETAELGEMKTVEELVRGSNIADEPICLIEKSYADTYVAVVCVLIYSALVISYGLL
jgi:hypothetical protein